MCEFSHTDSKQVKLLKKDAILGSRFFIYNYEDNTLKSLHRDFQYKSKITKGDIPDLNGDLGIYSYNNYNYNYNYYYYNNNKNNYYNNYNYNYNYKYYYYNYYYVSAVVRSYSNVILHNTGQRAEKIEIISFLSLKDHEDKKFLKDFNSKVETLAKQFKVKVQPYQFGGRLPIRETK